MARLLSIMMVLGVWFGFHPGTAIAQSDVAGETGPVEVGVYIFVNDINNVNLVAGTFEADLFIEMEWDAEGIDPSQSMVVVNPSRGWSNDRTFLYDRPEQLEDGSYYASFRYQGAFTMVSSMRSFPFDSHELKFVFEESLFWSDEVTYVPFLQEGQDDPNLAVALGADVFLPGWLFEDAIINISNQLTADNTFGGVSFEVEEFEAQLLESNDTLDNYSRIVVTIPMYRDGHTFAIKVILPIFLTVFTAGVAVALAAAVGTARVGVMATCLLTLVALQFQTVPQVNYVMLIDWVFIVALILVVVALLQVARSQNQAAVKGTGGMTRQDFKIGVAIPAVFTASLILLVIYYQAT